MLRFMLYTKKGKELDQILNFFQLELNSTRPPFGKFEDEQLRVNVNLTPMLGEDMYYLINLTIRPKLQLKDRYAHLFDRVERLFNEKVGNHIGMYVERDYVGFKVNHFGNAFRSAEYQASFWSSLTRGSTDTHQLNASLESCVNIYGVFKTYNVFDLTRLKSFLDLYIGFDVMDSNLVVDEPFDNRLLLIADINKLEEWVSVSPMRWWLLTLINSIVNYELVLGREIREEDKAFDLLLELRKKIQYNEVLQNVAEVP